MNLLKETLAALKENGKTENDVLWAGSRDMSTSWENFKKIADVEYDNGFGGQEVATDLMVVGNDWWLSRGEYEGSEWWNFNTLPIKPELEKNNLVVSGGSWDSLGELNIKTL